MVYRGEDTNNYLKELKDVFGAMPIEDTIEKEGFCYINLTQLMQKDEIENIRIKLCQRYMTAADYYDLKSFLYFTQENINRDAFFTKCKSVNRERLPFRFSDNSI